MNEIWFDLLHMRADLSLTVGLILALCITVHILLHKRDVPSAVGWIGLVWYAPFLGGMTYLVLGINRVRRRARRAGIGDTTPVGREMLSVELGSELAPLGRAIGRITEAPLLDGTRLTAFQNGDAAYPPMLAAIDAAEHSVALSSYIFRHDTWGGKFIHALAAAVKRGVQVRVLIDGVGGGWIWSRSYHALRRRGVPAARFMHSSLPWRMPFINLRSHKKILVVDGKVGFTGGMNIADENVMAMRAKAPVQDLHFRIDGQVVAKLMEAFAQDWRFATGETLRGDSWFPELSESEGGALARVIDSGPDEDLEKVEFAILEAVACARRRIAVMTPYFLPDERMVTALSLAAMRGVSVDIVAPGKTDHRMVDWAMRANTGPLLAAGVRVWFSPPPFHHTKLMVMDDEWCLIGSTNWDIRSFRLNFELCMEVYDRGLAETLIAVMERNRDRRVMLETLDGRSLVLRLRDAATRLMLPYL